MQPNPNEVDKPGSLMQVGDEITLIKGIFDDGEDHHPPGWLAQSGEVLVIRGLGKNGHITVSHHDVLDNAFWINPDEYTWNPQIALPLDGAPANSPRRSL